MSEDKESVTIVVFSGDLDRALAVFNIATAAAAMGMEVNLFFTFWGLNIITKEKTQGAKEHPLQKMMGMINRGGAKHANLSRMNMMGAGTMAMKKLMQDLRMPPLEDMIKMAKELGVHFLACTTTMALMGVEEEYLIPEVDEYVGAATYVEKAAVSKINLFV